jgi:hypothetical protein
MALRTFLFSSTPRVAAAGVALLLGACTVIPITPETLRGKYIYEGQPEGMWDGGEMIVLGEGSTFQYTHYTVDLVENPGSTRYPIHGHYKLDGSTITFLGSGIHYPQRTITRRHKLFVLWTPKELDDYRTIGKKPDTLLYQQKSE